MSSQMDNQQLQTVIYKAIARFVPISDPPDSVRTLASLGFETPRMVKHLWLEITRELTKEFPELDADDSTHDHVLRRVSSQIDLTPKNTVFELEERLAPLFEMLSLGRDISMAEAEPSFEEGGNETECEAALPGEPTTFGDPD